MNAPASTLGFNVDSLADTALKASARFWFAVAVAGQWVFVAYILLFYGASAVQGNWPVWNKVLPNGIIAGDAMGNIAVVLHILLAAIITIGGPLQLVPQIRARAPSFHRWNGRVYLMTVCIGAVTGLYMVWFRKGIGDLTQHIAISLNAILILFCAAMALRHALARRLDIHRRWALRLFLVVSGVWFFRVGMFLWLAIHRAPVGFDPDTFQGPFLSFLSFAQYLLPLAVLELYLRTRDRRDSGGTSARFAVAGVLGVLTVAMGAGVFAAAMGAWLPRI